MIITACAAAAAVAYGVNAALAQYSRGLQIIMIAHRLMWPMIAVTMLASISLFALVISGRRRIWWLVGLAPVMAMFVHRFAPDSAESAVINEAPQFVDSTVAAAPAAGDFVVGVNFSGRAFALPYRALFATPIVVLTDFDERMMVIWNAGANRAMAVSLKRDCRARDFEIVSTPANALLLFDRRLGQFISGVTGRRIDGSAAIGFGTPAALEKMPWSIWKSKYPKTVVMIGGLSESPTRPILPQYRMESAPSPEPTTPVAVLATTRPIAISNDAAVDGPINFSTGGMHVLVVRDRDGLLGAFDRHAREDLFLTFKSSSPTKRFPEAALVDVDTRSLWTIDGRAIDGTCKGEKLRPIAIDQGLYWGVMKYWYPDLELLRN